MSTFQQSLNFKVIAAVAAALAMLVAVALQAPAAAAQTTEATVCLESSEGVGLEGGRVAYHQSGQNRIGTTGPDGCLTAEVPVASARLTMEFRGGSVTTVGPVDLTQTYTFETRKVTLLNSVELAYSGGSGWNRFNSPMELLPDTYQVANNQDLSNAFTIIVGDSNFTGGLLRLVDHNGDGQAGGTASYYLAGWYGIPGTTDSNGNLVFSVPSDSAHLSVAMNYKGTQDQQSRAQLDASNFTFQTALARVQLKDADGYPLDTGHVQYYATGWRTFGSGATVGGEVTQEMLTGSYAIALSYNGGSQQLNEVAISKPETTVVFQTGRVTLHYSEAITWYHAGWHTFAKPTMEFLPATKTFYMTGLSTACGVDIPIASGDHIEKSLVVARLRTSSGQAIAGGVATAYANGAWRSVGTTNNAGYACQGFDGELGNTTVRMTHAGTSQTLRQHQPTESTYNFRTALVTVELRDSSNALIDTGSASYYAGGWHGLGDTQGGQITTQMLPGKYSFAMDYNGTREQKNQVEISGTATTVTFQTALVTVELHDSAGGSLDTGSASYYARGWHGIGDTSGGLATVEMLPGRYSFAMVYEGTREQRNGVTISGSATIVTFETVSVVSDSGAATSYYARGWRSFSSGDELLTGSYTFHFSDGTPNTKYTLVAGVENHIY